MISGARQRLRLRYRKDDVLMYISHRDLLRLVFKLLRRSEIPFAFSGRFSPKPRVTFGPALALGVSADNELLDIDLPDGVDWEAPQIAAAADRLAIAALPRDFVAGLSTLDVGSPSIAALAKAARYHILVDRETTMESGDLLSQLAILPEGTDSASGPLRGLTSLQQLEDRIVVDGQISAAVTFNVVRACAYWRDSIGLRYTFLHRACLLSEDGMPL